MKRSLVTMLIVGFALFSMLFGAGNVIFPPYLGLSCGAAWVEGFFYYYMADIGLALIALFAIQRCGGNDAIAHHIGIVPARVLISIIILCIGPMLGIPRTAASTFELSLTPLFPEADPIVFSAVFFLIVVLLCLKESAVIDIIGKILTPMLMLGLLILIIKGVIDPIGPIPGEVHVESVPITGIEAGYQTMDVLAVVIFGILISKNVRDKGYKELHEQNRIVFGAGMVAGFSLLVIYLGLTYLGVSSSDFFDTSIDRTVLVTNIVHHLLGGAGTYIFSIVVALACLTTAVALVSAASDYFSTLSGKRIKYTWLVVLISTFSAVVTTFGLNQIIAIAAPILDVVYPPTLFIVILSFLDKVIHNIWVYRLGALGACVSSLMVVAVKFGLHIPFVTSLPLYSLGFAWIVPALLCAGIGFLIPDPSPSK